MRRKEGELGSGYKRNISKGRERDRRGNRQRVEDEGAKEGTAMNSVGDK